AHAGRMERGREDGRRHRVDVHALVGRGHGARVGPVAAGDCGVRADARRAARGRRAPALRRAARAGRAPVAGAVLHGPVRALALPAVGKRRPLRLRGRCASGAGARPVPDRRLLHVQPLRGRPARARRARPARRAVQVDHAVDARRHDPAAAPVPDRARSGAEGLRRQLLDRHVVAADPARRADRERERRGGRVRPHHGGAHGLGPARVRVLLRPRPRRGGRARPRHGAEGGRDRPGIDPRVLQHLPSTARVAVRADPTVRPPLPPPRRPGGGGGRGDDRRARAALGSEVGDRPARHRARGRPRLLHRVPPHRSHAGGARSRDAGAPARSRLRRRRGSAGHAALGRSPRRAGPFVPAAAPVTPVPWPGARGAVRMSLTTGLYRLGRGAARRRFLVLGLWVLVAGAVFAAGRIAGPALVDDFRIPGSQAERALDVLRAGFPEQAGTTATIVFHARTGTLATPAAMAAIEGTLQRVAGLPHVVAVDDPTATGGEAGISRDRTIAFTTVHYDEGLTRLGRAAADRLSAVVAPARAAGLQVELGGPLVEFTHLPEPRGSEIVGLTAAVVVLFLAFGSLTAMGLPIVTALLGLGTSLAIVWLISHVGDIPTLTPTLATMLGLGVGIDYSLFIVTRFREGLGRGLAVG